MIEIKFRAWDKINKKMVYQKYPFSFGISPDHPDIELGTYFKQTYGKRVKWSADEMVPMQYIGIKDKKGKEVYEGDIVKHCNGYREVYYDEDTYSFQMELNHAVLDQEVSVSSEDIEVVGNIYENSELLDKSASQIENM